MLYIHQSEECLGVRVFELVDLEELRDCLVNQSAGEHEGFLVQRRTIFEARSGATGRKNGRRWGKKTRAQPGILLPNSLSNTLTP